MNTLNPSFLHRLLSAIARYRWALLIATLVLLTLGFVIAQTTTPVPSGGTISLTAQVVGPTTSPTLNSNFSVTSSDEVQFTTSISQPMPNPSNRDGTMTFPANFTWMPGSISAPPTAKNMRWNKGTVTSPIWVYAPPEWKPGLPGVANPPEPAAGTVVSQFAWTLAPDTVLEIKPSSLGTVNFSGTGDGFRVFTYRTTNPTYAKDHVYVLNHHTDKNYINCRDATTGLTCTNYAAGGKDVSAVEGETLGTGPGVVGFYRNTYYVYEVPGPPKIPGFWFTEIRYGKIPQTTPQRSIEHLNKATGELFFYVADRSIDNIGDTTVKVRVLCANLDTMKSCAKGDVLGSASLTTSPESVVNPIGSVGNKYYAVDKDSKIYCYDVSIKGACTGSYPVAAKYTNASVSATSMNLVLGSKLLYITQGKLACFNTETDTHCSEAGWNNASDVAKANQGVYPVLNSDGSVKGACIPAKASTSTPFACRDLNGVAFTPSASYISFLNTNQMFTANKGEGYNAGAYTQVNFYGTQVFHTSSNDVNTSDSQDYKSIATCFDFAVGMDKECTGFPLAHAASQTRVYAITKDTVRENCMWSIGDAAVATAFDPRDGKACKPVSGIPSEINIQIDPVQSMRCDGSATPIRGWKAVRFSPTLKWGPGFLEALSVDITDAAGNAVGATRYFDKDMFSLDISDISYTTYPKLNFKIKPTIGSSSINGTAAFDVTWEGDPVQVCVKVKAPSLATCSAVAASTESLAVAVHSPLDSADRLYAEQAGTAGVLQSGLGPVANSTTLIQQPKGGSDPTQVLQTRFNMPNFTGDLYQYELLSVNTLSEQPISKASDEAVSNRKYFTSNGAATGQPTLAGLGSDKWANLSFAQQALLNRTKTGAVDALGQSRVAYITGDRTKESTLTNGAVTVGSFRARAGLLGPAIDSSPAILQSSIQAGLSADKYPNYTNFKRNVARANKLVFYSANDNFLHAYKVSATGLSEAFSYLPSIAIPDVPRFTDSSLREITAKPYFMDNTPMVADVNVAPTKAGDDWRSVVVANRGRGGRGVFALDVTGDKTKSNATQTRPDGVLFEYSNTTTIQTGEDSLADLGYNLGQPPSNKVTGSDQIVRVRSGTGGTDARWAYITGNGVDGSVGKDGKACNLNNGPCSQKAVLYIFYLNGNLTTGARWKRIPVHADATTTAGLDTDLDFGNGLSTPRPTDVNGDGVVDYVYAGDLKGNLWRFDLTDMSNVVVTKIFKTDDAQPIHTAPVLISTSGAGTCTASASNTRACMMVVTATGQETNPIKPLIASTKLQRLYGIFDKTDLSGASALVTTDKLTAQTISTTTSTGTNGLTYRTVSSAAVDYVNGQRGWKIALPSNEHNTANPVMQSNGTVLFATTLPSTTAPTCSDGWLTQVNATTGSGLLPFAIGGVSASVKLPNSLEGVGSYSVPSSLGGGSLNSAQASFITATLKGSASNVFTTARELMLGRMSWREVFGAPKN